MDSSQDSDQRGEANEGTSVRVCDQFLCYSSNKIKSMALDSPLLGQDEPQLTPSLKFLLGCRMGCLDQNNKMYTDGIEKSQHASLNRTQNHIMAGSNDLLPHLVFMGERNALLFHPPSPRACRPAKIVGTL